METGLTAWVAPATLDPALAPIATRAGRAAAGGRRSGTAGALREARAALRGQGGTADHSQIEVSARYP